MSCFCPDYKPGRYSAVEIGLACLESALKTSLGSLKASFTEYIGQILSDTPILMVRLTLKSHFSLDAKIF